MALSQSALPSSDLRIAILFGFLIPIHATCLAHLAFLNLFTLMTKYLVTGTNYVGPTWRSFWDTSTPLRNKVLFRHTFPTFPSINCQIIFVEAHFICTEIIKHVTSGKQNYSPKTTRSQNVDISLRLGRLKTGAREMKNRPEVLYKQSFILWNTSAILPKGHAIITSKRSQMKLISAPFSTQISWKHLPQFPTHWAHCSPAFSS